jgi:hypothetical protein
MLQYQCIGQRRVKLHAGEKGKLVRCENSSEAPSNPDKPSWGYLCSECASSTSKHEELAEQFNALANQQDVTEFRDHISAGFAAGASRGYDGDDGE